MRQIILKRIERLVNRCRNAIEKRCDPRTMKSAEITETRFVWRYRDESEGPNYDAGMKLDPNPLKYRTRRIIRTLTHKYDQRLPETKGCWVRLNSLETDEYIKKNNVADRFIRSFETKTAKFDAHTNTLRIMMTLADLHQLRKERELRKLRLKYQPLLRQKYDPGESSSTPDPMNFNCYPWDTIPQSVIDKYV